MAQGGASGRASCGRRRRRSSPSPPTRKLSAPRGASASRRSISAAAPAPPEPRSSQSLEVELERDHSLAVELEAGGLAQRPQARRRQAGPVRGVAQPLDLLVPGGGVAVVVGDVVGDDAPSRRAAPPAPSPPAPVPGAGMWWRLKRVTAPSKLPSSSSSAVASPSEKLDVVEPLAARLRARLLDHRRGQVDAVHRADPRRERAARPAPGPQATSSQRASGSAGTSSTSDPRVSAALIAAARAKVVGLVGELLADRVLVHAPIVG